MKTHDLLLGVGVEEIPARMIEDALTALKDRFFEVLGQQLPDWNVYATPRRLILVVRGIPDKEPDRKEVVTGPPISAGEGARAGFAKKMGVDPAQLKTIKTPKGEYLSFTRKIKGRKTREVLAEILPRVILGIPWPKTMTWTTKSGPRFIRPIRRLVAVYGGRVVPFEIAGVKSGNLATGHRRLHGDKNWDRIKVTDLESLREGLGRNSVILDAGERRERIQQGIKALLPEGLRLIENETLLETHVYLNEYPTPILGSFDPEFLSLRWEVLVTVMQHHQKYFSVEDARGKLAPHFIAVMNIDRDEGGIVRHGNERVLRARFNDARFFWETDQKKKLADRVDDLKGVVFHAKLGSYYDKTQRNVELVKKLGGDEYAQRAALLAKCDLTTELVKEFPELQGVVGGLYARHQKEPEEVAVAICEQYNGLGTEGLLPYSRNIPSSKAGQIVALADRLDTLQSFFRVGIIPSGSKDPFALRRTALGVVRILVQGKYPYSLRELAGSDELRDFLLDRFRFYLRDHAYDEVNAVLAAGTDDLVDAAERLEALSRVRSTENFEPLATSFKRIKNILRQAGVHDHAEPDPALLEAGPERELYDATIAARTEIKLRNTSYGETLEIIASLRPRVDLFFDKVLVNAPDPKIRANRLNFLAQLLREFSTIADFSEIVTSGD